VSGLQRVQNESANDSTSPKAATVQCPAGKVAIGGGAFISPSDGTAVLTVTEPTTSPAGWQANAAEPTPTASNWKVIAIALCANVS
jgi:hypothetical protein